MPEKLNALLEAGSRFSKQAQAAILLPVVNTGTQAIVRALRQQFGSRLKIIIPSNYDSLGPDVLRELQHDGARIQTFSTTPLEVSEAYYHIALRAACQYELGRLAIPVHYQNVRDQLRREYGFSTLRDAQVRAILSASQLARETAPGVYQARTRFRDAGPRARLRVWVEVLSAGLGDLFDLPAYSRFLSRWFEAAGGEGVVAWIEVTDQSDTCVAWLSTEKAVVTLDTRQPGTAYSTGISIAESVADGLEALDDDVVDQLGRAQAIRERLLCVPSGSDAISALKDYADLWIRFVRRQRLRGQSQKWRGWYLVPEHGPLTIEKLRELRAILAAMPALTSGGLISLDTDEEGVSNANALLSAAAVKYRGQYSRSAKRNLFIRQQKNYLLRLGLITEPVARMIALTDTGQRWIGARGDAGLITEYVAVLEKLRWAWCNMPFFAFLRDLSDRVDGVITYQELFNWVIHAYDASQLDELEAALTTFRCLTRDERARINDAIGTKLKRQLDSRISTAAFGHYRTKIRDMMVAFATTGEFRLDDTGPEWVLTRRAPKQKR